MRILVVGASGNIGNRAAIELFRSGQVERLHLGARDGAEASALAARFSTESATTVRGAAIDLEARDLSERFAGEDVIVNCAGPGYEFEERAVRAAVDAGVDYISLCDDQVATERVAGHDGDARHAGVSVVSGCGLSPGITSFLVEVGAAELDEVHEVHIAVAASSADSDGPASARHLLHSFSREAPFLSGGTRMTEPAGTGPKLVYFPEPVGWVETFICGHPEVSTLPLAHPDLATLQFRIGLTERIAMDLIRGSRAAGLLRSEGLRKAWLAATRSSRSLVEKLPPRGAPWTAARVDLHGTSNGTASIVSLGVVDHLVNLASVTVAEAGLALGRGEARTKGVRGPEEMFDAPAMLARLSKRGIRAARLESELV